MTDAHVITRGEHWDEIYRSTAADRASWYQPEPQLSLSLIRRVATDRADPIIDVGGGASTLVDGLLAAGHLALTVLDIAVPALEVARQRLGERAGEVEWVHADVLSASLPEARYAVWHDRAAFHFLTRREDRRGYAALLRRALRPGGHAIIASFATDGPLRCSGLEIVRYAPESLQAELGGDFELVDSVREEHRTPAGAAQPFIYCLFRLSGRAERARVGGS